MDCSFITKYIECILEDKEMLMLLMFLWVYMSIQHHYQNDVMNINP